MEQFSPLLGVLLVLATLGLCWSLAGRLFGQSDFVSQGDPLRSSTAPLDRERRSESPWQDYARQYPSRKAEIIKRYRNETFSSLADADAVVDAFLAHLKRPGIHLG